MKIAIVGYGKMGRLIDQLAPEFDSEVVLRLDEYNNADGCVSRARAFAGVDVAIEFSTPHTVVANVERLAAVGVNTSVGTTGWAENYDNVQQTVEEKRHRPRLESELLGRSQRVLSNRSPKPRACSRTRKNTAPGLGRSITTPRRTLHREPC